MAVDLDKKEFEVLNYLDIYHMVPEFKNFVDALELDQEIITEKLESLKKKDLVEGEWKITPKGEETVDSFREKMVGETDREEEFLELCDRFEEVNPKFKQLVTEFQTQKSKTLPGEDEPSLPLNQLEDIHTEVTDILEKISNIFPHIGRYLGKLDSALEKMREENTEYLAMQKNSYHNVWHELHEYLLKLSQREREE